MRRVMLTMPDYETPCSHGLRKQAKPWKADEARRMRRHPTSTEAKLWQKLRARGCGGFKIRRQAVILGWIADFYCPERRVIIEVDGNSHSVRVETDRRRDWVLCEAGIATLRLDAEFVENDLEAAVSHIKRTLEMKRLPRSSYRHE